MRRKIYLMLLLLHSSRCQKEAGFLRRKRRRRANDAGTDLMSQIHAKVEGLVPSYDIRNLWAITDEETDEAIRLRHD